MAFYHVKLILNKTSKFKSYFEASNNENKIKEISNVYKLIF